MHTLFSIEDDRNIDETKERQSDRHLPFQFKCSFLENIEGALSDMENVTLEYPIITSLKLMPNKNRLFFQLSH
jgi:hypothetical protein